MLINSYLHKDVGRKISRRSNGQKTKKYQKSTIKPLPGEGATKKRPKNRKKDEK